MIFFFNLKKSLLFLIEGKLFYSIVLVSSKHQHESAIRLPMSPLTRTSLPPPPHPTPLGGYRGPV